MKENKSYTYPRHLSWRLLEAAFRLLALLGMPWVLMRLNQLFKPNTRPLTPRERSLAQRIFGNSIQYDAVRIDDRARIVCRDYRMAYVAFQVINSWGRMADVHFIHEMVHIWQYQHVGVVYIPRALWAQRTPMGYNYGGPEALTGRDLLDFNYEQQADIVADYFCLLHGYRPRWCPLDAGLMPVFERVIFSTFTSPT